jgi:hypothetical protein
MNNYKVTSPISLKNSITKEVNDDAEQQLKKLRKKISKHQDAMYVDMSSRNGYFWKGQSDS